MSDDEFGHQAAEVARQLADRGRFERTAGASRGSGNPAALAWLAESLRVDADTAVIDVGVGLGGPAAWLVDRYGARVVGVEPEHLAARGAASLFGLGVVVGSAGAIPVQSAAFDVALLLGVLSTLPDRRAALAEAGRVALRLGVLEYCATGGRSVDVGGSSFPTERELTADLELTGWHVHQRAPVAMPTPDTWTEAADDLDVATEESEDAVADAIARGDISPLLVVAHR